MPALGGLKRLKNIYDKIKKVECKVIKLRDVLKKALSGDLSELRNLSDVYIKDSKSSVNSYKNFF